MRAWFSVRWRLWLQRLLDLLASTVHAVHMSRLPKHASISAAHGGRRHDLTRDSFLRVICEQHGIASVVKEQRLGQQSTSEQPQ